MVLTVPIFMQLKPTRRHYAGIFYTKCHPNRSRNVESAVTDTRLSDHPNQTHNIYSLYTFIVQGDQKVSVHLITTIQKVTSNVQSVPRQSPDIY